MNAIKAMTRFAWFKLAPWDWQEFSYNSGNAAGYSGWLTSRMTGMTVFRKYETGKLQFRW